MKPWSRVCVCLLLWFCVSAGVLPALTPASGQQAKKAAPAAKKSSPAALRLFNDAASFQNNKAYDLAVEEWGKFLAKHADDPLAPKARHYLGICNLQLKPPRYAQAIAAFQAVIKNHPQFELIQDTYLNLGWCQHSLAKQGKAPMYAQAAATFAALAEHFPKGKGKYIDDALYFRGESLFHLNKRKEAAGAYQQLVDDHPQSKRRCDALYALGVTRQELGQYALAGKVYDIFLKECGKSELMTEVRMRKAETLLQAGQLDQAGRMFAEVAAVKGFASADHAIQRQAYCDSKQEKFAEAGDLYAKIPTSYPQSAYANSAAMDAGRSYYRAKKFAAAAKWFAQILAGGKKDAHEAAHWLCKIHLQKKEYARAAELAGGKIAAAEKSEYLVPLKMDQADAVYEQAGKQAEAMALYLKIASGHAQHDLAPRALYNAAYAALQLNQYEQGLEHAARFLKSYLDHSLLVDVQYVAAECNLHLKKYAAAEKMYHQLAERNTDHADRPLWQLRRGLTLFLQDKYQDTTAYLAPLVPKFKSQEFVAEAQFLAGTSHFYLGGYADAVSALKASLAASSKWRQADETLLNLARARSKLKNSGEAKASLQKLIADYPDSQLLDRAHFRLAQLGYEAEDYKTAVEEYDRVIANWPKSPLAAHAHYGKGWSQLRQQLQADAAKSFTALIQAYPSHRLTPEAHYARAICRQQLGDFKAAMVDVGLFVQSSPGKPQKCDALYIRGLCEVGLKDYAAAAETFEAILKDFEEYPSAAKVLYELAWAYKSRGNEQAAVKTFAQLAGKHAADPLAAEAHYHIGEDHYKKSNFAEAVKLYVQAKAKAGQGELSEKASYKLAWAHYKLQQYDLALKVFSGQVQAYPEGPLAADGLFMRAESLFKAENYKQALPAYLKARAVPASNKQYAVLLLLHGGQSAGQLEKWEDAARLLAEIQEKHPDSVYLPESLYELGWTRQNQGQLDEALKLYEAVTGKSRDHVGARARFMMGEVHFSRKAYNTAIRDFQRVMYGFGGERATAPIKKWQAKAGYEAGRCAEVQIQGATNPQKRAQFVALATRHYRYVATKHENISLASLAKQRLTELAKLQ